jgi:hypothetical protein
MNECLTLKDLGTEWARRLAANVAASRTIMSANVAEESKQSGFQKWTLALQNSVPTTTNESETQPGQTTKTTSVHIDHQACLCDVCSWVKKRYAIKYLQPSEYEYYSGMYEAFVNRASDVLNHIAGSSEFAMKADMIVGFIGKKRYRLKNRYGPVDYLPGKPDKIVATYTDKHGIPYLRTLSLNRSGHDYFAEDL